MRSNDVLDRLSARLPAAVGFDARPSHRAPRVSRVALAGVVACGVSLLADWLLARLAVAIVPANRGYPHFAFADYGKLTVIGVVVAVMAWPLVARFSAAPRSSYLRLAVIVTVVLLLPDLAIWVKGQPGSAVVFLALMHVAIAVVTYVSVVALAPVRRPGASQRIACSVSGSK